MLCPHCGTPCADRANFCGRCGRPLGPAGQGVGPEPAPGPAMAGSPPLSIAPPPAPVTGDDTGGIIPYKNGPALVGYYLGVFSLIPCLGLPLGIAAIPLGIAGLRKRRVQPVIKGGAHAWIAIVLGSISVLLWGGLLVAGIVGQMLSHE